MIQENYDNIKNWFNDHISYITSVNTDVNIDFELKKEHSLRVSQLVRELGESVNLTDSDLLLAECTALLHDVGQLQKLARVNGDDENLDNAEIGCNLIKENQLLHSLEENEREIILSAVALQDQIKLPKIEDKNQLFFMQLLRDADKLDLYRIATEYYCTNKINPIKDLGLDLSEKQEVSKKVCNKILSEKVVNMDDVVSINDYKLMQMSWIYDMNLKRSFQIINEKAYLRKIYETLPKKDQVIDMYRTLKIFLENKL